jgi:hypothetical protein
VVEHRDGVPAGVGTGDLDRVLDGLRARVEQRRLLRVVTRSELRQLLAHVDVTVVGRDHEARVRERGDLLDDPAGDLRRSVAHAGHGDAGPEVDQRVAVGVDQHAPAGGLDEDRQCRADTGGDVFLPPGQLRPRDRAGDLGDQAPLLRQPGTPRVRG